MGMLIQVSSLDLHNNSLIGIYLHRCTLLFLFLWYVIGSVPSSICQITQLHKFDISLSHGNAGISCAPTCVSSVPILNVPSAICPSNQSVGLCGFIAATNIHNISGYSQWSCTTTGVTTTNPCSWSGITCDGRNNVVSIGIYGLKGRHDLL